MWSRRAQEYDQKINSGKIYELAEVVKDLNKNSDIIADQSYSERQLFEKAFERLKSEFQAVLQISPEEVLKKMNKALGKNKSIAELE
jgi:CarD family transcriptional regulator